MRTYHFTRKQLQDVLQGAIEMFLEFRDVHEHEEEAAKFDAVDEVMEGLDADRELAMNDPTERLRLQLPDKEGQMRAHLEAIRDYIENPSAPTVNAGDMNFYQRMDGIHAQATAALDV